MMIVSEIWQIIISFCSLDVKSFGSVCNDSLKITQHDQRFVSRIKLVSSVIDFDDLYNFLNRQF